MRLNREKLPQSGKNVFVGSAVIFGGSVIKVLRAIAKMTQPPKRED